MGSTIKVDDVDNDFHFAKRKTTGSWINTGLFTQVWKAIGRKGTYLNYDWIIKVDPDAVFFPHKLIARIHNLPVPPTGVYLNNCENVDSCKRNTVANWKVGVDGGKYGPMGEDLFAQICLEKNGVAKLDAFDIDKDGACEAKRPLNEKKNKKWHAD